MEPGNDSEMGGKTVSYPTDADFEEARTNRAPPKKSARSVTNDVLNEVLIERSRQDEKWGSQNHPDIYPLTGETFLPTARAAKRLEIPTAVRAKALCQNDAAAGATNWASILVEELSEAVEQAALKNEKSLREEIIQCAAVCVAWIEAIDRRKP